MPAKLLDELRVALEEAGRARAKMPTAHVLEAALASELLDVGKAVGVLMDERKGPTFEHDNRQVRLG